MLALDQSRSRGSSQRLQASAGAEAEPFCAHGSLAPCGGGSPQFLATANARIFRVEGSGRRASCTNHLESPMGPNGDEVGRGGMAVAKLSRGSPAAKERVGAPSPDPSLFRRNFIGRVSGAAGRQPASRAPSLFRRNFIGRVSGAAGRQPASRAPSLFRRNFIGRVSGAAGRQPASRAPSLFRRSFIGRVSGAAGRAVSTVGPTCPIPWRALRRWPTACRQSRRTGRACPSSGRAWRRG
jgi:hypothetical protein